MFCIIAIAILWKSKMRLSGKYGCYFGFAVIRYVYPEKMKVWDSGPFRMTHFSQACDQACDIPNKFNCHFLMGLWSFITGNLFDNLYLLHCKYDRWFIYTFPMCSEFRQLVHEYQSSRTWTSEREYFHTNQLNYILKHSRTLITQIAPIIPTRIHQIACSNWR